METDIGAWSERQRLMFIERVLYWRGWINRRDLRERFGISAPQATNDLVTYTSLNPGGCSYSVRAKRYVVSPRMKPKLIVPDIGEDFAWMGAGVLPEAEVPFIAYPETPARVSDVGVLRQLSLAAYSRESVEIEYWSVNSGASQLRRISPRTFANDGLRWHVRAFCHRDECFKDFVVGRISQIGKRKECPNAGIVDEDWVTFVCLRIRPNEGLSENRRRALEMDYGMENGELVLHVRRAMVLYTRRRLGFVKKKLTLPMDNELRELQLVAIEELGG